MEDLNFCLVIEGYGAKEPLLGLGGCFLNREMELSYSLGLMIQEVDKEASA